jgi:hypothetical protein
MASELFNYYGVRITTDGEHDFIWGDPEIILSCLDEAGVELLAITSSNPVMVKHMTDKERESFIYFLHDE